MVVSIVVFFFSSRRRHTRYWRDWSSDVCSSDLCPWHEGFFVGRNGPSTRSAAPHVPPRAQENPMTTPTSESATREAAAALDGVETTRPATAVRAGEGSTGRATEPATGITGAQSLVRSLEAAGVDVIFGIPGGAILPAYDPLFDS